MEGFADTGALFAVSGHRDAATLALVGLQAQRHRGRDHAAIAASDGALVRHRRVADLPPGGSLAEVLPGALAIGKTWGAPEPLREVWTEGEAPPAGESEAMIAGRYRGGQLVAAFAGRVTNAARLRRELKAAGAVLQTPSDAELLLHLVAQSTQHTFVNRLVDALWKIEGAWCLLAQCEDRVVAVRGPGGFRPLLLGRFGDAWTVSTEDTPVRMLRGEVRRELAPGEMVILDGRGSFSVSPFPPRPLTACAQEHVSLARSECRSFDRPTRDVRAALGSALGRMSPCPGADLVTAWPGPSEAFALGYARATGVPYEPVVAVEGPAPGAPGSSGVATAGVDERRAALPDLRSRLTVRVDPAAVSDRVVVLVARALSTGHGLRRAVALLLEAGAREVHVRVGSPPVRSACPYGVWSPTSDELADPVLAADPHWLGATSTAHLPLEALREILADSSGSSLGAERGWCDACLSGHRPLVTTESAEDQLELF